jgi:hypothetical protein
MSETGRGGQGPEYRSALGDGTGARQESGSAAEPPPATPYMRSTPPKTIAARLESDRRHPVLLFGSNLAGKSTLIASLMYALSRAGLNNATGVDYNFGTSFYKYGDERAQYEREAARSFYEQAPHMLTTAEIALPSTQVDGSFFLPLDIAKTHDDDPPVRIALMDGKGEQYLPRTGTEGTRAAPLPDSVRNIFEQYSRGLSIIIVAPFSLGNTDVIDTQASDLGLEFVLHQYMETRDPARRERDSILFLLTKWDQRYSPESDSMFLRLDGADVLKEIGERYKGSWSKFCNMGIGRNSWGRRSFMQYSACRFVGDRPRIEDELRPKFLRYHHTVLNWIYGNARLVEILSDEEPSRIPASLFPYVAPEGDRIVSIPRQILRRIATFRGQP